jgi:ubiquitin-protein ligase
MVSWGQDIGNLQIIGTEVDAERFKSNRRVRILFLATARLLQSPSLDDAAAAAAEELFRNSPATITRSVKYGTALKIRM